MKKLKVLFAEDDELTRWEIENRLKSEGWTAIAAADGLEAWEKFQRECPDVVILDMDMPGRNGVEVLQLIRSVDFQTPVIVFSALADEYNLLAGYNNGAKVYIVKSDNLFCLVPQIKAILADKNRKLYRLAKDASFDPERNEVFLGNKSISLYPLDGKFLSLLCANRNRLVLRDMFLTVGWNSTEIRWEQQLNKAISRIKQILKNIDGVEIKTESGRGYRLLVDFEEVE